VTEIMHLWRQRFFRRLLEMPRNQKRLLMVLADLVCIPAALWTAMTLKQGTPLHASLDDSWLYLAAIMSSVPVFVRLGLYRAVVRFLGTRALLTVVTGVSVSVGLLLIVNQLMLGKGVHISTLPSTGRWR
jgi:FlaA1/EpsC-like NDP-sugar epimerase